MRRAIRVGLLALAGMVASCGGDANGPADMATTPAADLATATALAPCLDRPDVLPRPPENVLPCELIPPSF